MLRQPRVLFGISVYIIYHLLGAANRTGFPGAGTAGGDGRRRTAARQAANPHRRWATGLPPEPYSPRKAKSGRARGAGGGRDILHSQPGKVKRIGTE